MNRLCWHDWSKWESYKQEIIEIDRKNGTKHETFDYMQKRVCRKCGKEIQRKVG